MTTQENNKHNIGAFMLAGVSFIPSYVGIFAGIVCIINAAFTRTSNSMLLGSLGLGGLIFNLVIFPTILTLQEMYEGDFFKGRAFEPHAISAMTSLIRNIEYIKMQSGSYPKSMTEIRENLKDGEMVVTHDVSASFAQEHPKGFFYELINDGNNYILFGIGIDGIPFTEDDIYPIIDPHKDRNIGWVKRKLSDNKNSHLQAEKIQDNSKQDTPPEASPIISFPSHSSVHEIEQNIEELYEIDTSKKQPASEEISDPSLPSSVILSFPKDDYD